MELRIATYHHFSTRAFVTLARRIALCPWSTLLVILVLNSSICAFAQIEHIDTLSVNVNFRQSQVTLDPTYMQNGANLKQFIEEYNELNCECDTPIIHILGYASPEGSIKLNQRLSRDRAKAIGDYLEQHLGVPESRMEEHPLGEDWEDLYQAVLQDPNVPNHDALIDIIKNASLDTRKAQVQKLDDGRTHAYLLENIYPKLRGARTEVYCIRHIHELAEVSKPDIEYIPTDTAKLVTPQIEPEPTYVPIFWSLHTNMLYDAAVIPNLGAELYIGNKVSIAANWWYAWWEKDRKHRYWRTYGGYIAPRYWFGKAAAAKPLTGHHIGLYAQMMLYDFELGGTGYLSGTPYKNIFHRPTWGGGIEYGFALPIRRRLNIDFTIGLGFLKGRYWKYEPLDDGYRWISIHNLNWLGPTKLEISLVWLLGDVNYNVKKGGKR